MSTESLKKSSYSEVIDLIKNNNKKEYNWVFDCDGTLINGDIASHTAWVLLQDKNFAEELPIKLKNQFDINWTDAPYEKMEELREAFKNNGDSGEDFYHWETRGMCERSPQALEDVAIEALDIGLKQGTLSLTPEVSKLATEFTDQAYIVSGSPNECVRAIARKLKVDVNKVFSTSIKVDPSTGLLIKELEEPGLVWEEEKRIILKTKNIDHPYIVFGDSIGDWHMLEASTHFSWCVLWGEYRHRGQEFFRIINDRLFSGQEILKNEVGIYSYRQKINGLDKTWILEIMPSFT